MVQLIGDFHAISVCLWGFDHAGTSCGNEMAGRRSRWSSAAAQNKAREKARQAGRMPTIVLVDISPTGWSWMRGPQAMIPALQKILSSTPFAGLGVFTTSLDSAEPMQTHLAIASTVEPETTTLIDQAAGALNLNAYNS